MPSNEERPVETSLYYITSRYYDPEIERFISPDSVDYLDPTTINGLNLYAYCGNDPVNRWDPTGHFAISTLLIALGAIVASAAISIAIGNYQYDKYENEEKIKSYDDGSIEIIDSWKIWNPISRLTFLYRLTNSEKYSQLLTERNIFSLALEWDLHNFATDLSILTQVVTAPVDLLTSNSMFWIIPNEIRKHSDDVYLDNNKYWWDILGWFK